MPGAKKVWGDVVDTFKSVASGIADFIGGVLGLRDEERTTVATYVARLIPDDSLPNCAQSAVLKAALKDKEVDPLLVQEMSKSIGIKASAAYRYSKKNYTFGSASQKLFSAISGEVVVKQTLEALNPLEKPKFIYYHFGAMNYYHYAWTKVVELYGYNSQTNQLATLSVQKKTPVYLEDIVLVVSDSTFKTPKQDAISKFGVSPTSGETPSRLRNEARPYSNIIVDSGTIEDIAKIEVCWAGVETVTVEGVPIVRQVTLKETIILPLTPIKDASGFYQVSFMYKNSVKYWSYKTGSKTYPTIDGIYDNNYSTLGSYFPMIHIMSSNVPVHTDKTSASYKSSVKMAKYLGIGYEQVREGIAKNPQSGLIEQAFITMAIPSISKDAIEQKYLFDFFNQMYTAKVNQGYDIPALNYTDVAMQTSSVDYSALENGRGNFANYTLANSGTGQLGGSTGFNLVIQDKLFKMSLGCSEIRKLVKAGNIGKVGVCSSAYGTETLLNQVGVNLINQFAMSTVSVNKHTYQRQFTESLVEEITVYGLNITYYIWKGHNIVGNGNDATLLIPLDYAITDDYGVPDRERLYTRSLHLVVNSRQTTVVKWYQTGIIQDLLKIGAVIMAFYTAGQSLQIYAAAFAAGATIAAISVMVATNIFVAVAIQEAVTVVVKEIGPDAALLLAVMAVARAGYSAFKAGSLQGAPYALELLQTASSISIGIGKAVGEKIVGLQEESKAFNLLSDAKEQKLKEAEKLLERNPIASPIILFGEKPGDFYNRTVHSGNVGVLSNKSTSEYVSLMLQLPKPATTLLR